jgi:hypothetical protein
MSALAGVAVILAAWAVGLAVWDTLRKLGAHVGDRDYIEGAPILAGVLIAVAYLPVVVVVPAFEGSAATMDQPLWLWIAKRAVMLGASTSVFLLGVEWALWDEGRLPDHEWRLFGGIGE